MPLDTPFFILIKKLPTAPPVTDAGENAPWNIDLNTAGTLLILTSTTPMARIIYNTAINGMSFSVTLPILFIPPIIISAIRIIIIIPIIRLIIWVESADIML